MIRIATYLRRSTRWLLLGGVLAVAARTAEPRCILFLTADGFRSDYIERFNPPLAAPISTARPATTTRRRPPTRSSTCSGPAGPRFVAAIFGATDQAGHRHGARPRRSEGGRAGHRSRRRPDRLGLEGAGPLRGTLITFNSDHGMSAYEKKNGAIEPARALAQAGFRGAAVDAARTIDVVPTLLRAVHARPAPSVDGRPILAALE